MVDVNMDYSKTRRDVLRQAGSAAVAMTGMGAATNARAVAQNGGSYPMFQYDAANTGYSPNASGPTDSVTQKWAFTAGEPIRASPVVANKTVYFGHSSGKTFALDTKTGNRQWQAQTGSVNDGLAVVKGRVYVPASKEKSNKIHLRSLFGSNGTEIWNVPLGRTQNVDPGRQVVDFSPIATNEFILVGGETAQMVHPERGDTQWTRGIFQFEGTFNRRTYTDQKGDYLVAGNAAVRGKQAYIHFEGNDRGDPRHSRLAAINTKTGENKWVLRTRTRVPLTVSNSMVWGAREDILYALSEGKGKHQWEFRTGPVNASPAVANGTVYVGSDDSKFYALSVGDGSLEWLVPTDAPVRSAPVVADGAVYFGTDGGTVYALEAKTGKQLWTFSTGGKVRSSPAVVNGTVYIGSEDKKFYALTE